VADRKISALADGGAGLATDAFVVARSGSNVKLTGASLVTMAAGSVTVLGAPTGGNDGPLLQAALDSLPSTGGLLVIPRAVYSIQTLVTCSKKGVNIVGQGGVSYSESLASPVGSALVFSGTGGLKFDGGSGLVQSGPKIIDVTLIEAADANTLTLLEIKRMNNWTCERVGFRGGLVALKVNSDNATWGGATAGGDASWGLVDQCVFRHPLTGIYVPYTGGFVVRGGNFSLTTGGGDGSTAISANGGSQRRYLGVKVDQGDYGIVDKGGTVLVDDSEFEAQSVACVSLDGNALADDGKFQKVTNCHFDPKSAVGAKSIWIKSGVRRAPLLKNNTFVNITATWIQDDAGLGYRREDDEGYFEKHTTFAPTSSSTLLDLTSDVALFNLSGASGSGLTCKLPTVSGAKQVLKGRRYTIKNLTASKTLTIQGNASETIDGASTFILPNQYGAVILECDGTNWVVVGRYAAAATVPVSTPVVLPPTGGGNTWTDMPSAETEFNGAASGSRYRFHYDFTQAKQIRLVRRMATVGASGAKLVLKYSTDGGSTWSYFNASASGPSVAIDATTSLAGSWVDIDAGGRADVLVGLFGSGGDGATDPIFGAIHMQVR
jgi:hypothetical protein